MGAHAEGNGGTFTMSGTQYTSGATASYAHSEGDRTLASGSCSHAEGAYNIAKGNQAHAEGTNNLA